MEYMSLDKYFKLIAKKWKILLYFVLSFIGLAIFYGIFLYTPTYSSDAKILLKQNNTNTYVTELNSDNEVSTLGQNQSPVLTQIEILNSSDMALKVAEKLSKETGFEDIPSKNLASYIKQSFKFSNPTGTNIIGVSVRWNNPRDAQKVAEALLDTYYNYNEGLYKKSISSTKTYIGAELKDTNKKLKEVRDEIEKYRKKNSSIDVNAEAQSVIAQSGRISDTIAEIDGNIASTGRRVDELSSNLGIGVKKAIDSVALGQSESLVKLNQVLLENQQKLAALKIKYPDSTPQVRVLTSEINEIKDQIESETMTLIGKKPVSDKNSLIADSVRSGMVQDYVQNSIEFSALSSQKAALQKILSGLNSSHNTIPELQKNLQSMEEKEKNLSSIAQVLNAKLVEANIKESSIISNVDIIQAPLLSTRESFPSFINILGIFIFIGLLMGVSTVLGLYMVEDICDGARDLEDIIKAPVLGIIPWLTNSAYNNFLTDYNPHSVVAIIYQKIATSIKVKCYKKKINSIAIISAELEKRRSIVAASLANTLAKTKDKIILIDTDFRDGSLTREFNIDFSNYPDITDLILELSKLSLSEDSNANYNEIISRYIVQIPEQKSLYLIPNNNKIDNPYEILNNDAFPMLMQKLKNNFDLVIVDTPPMLAVSDSIIASQHLDGLIVLCGIKTSRSNLRKIRKICDDNYVEILGAIARDKLTELEVPENMYIKQLSGNIN